MDKYERLYNLFDEIVLFDSRVSTLDKLGDAINEITTGLEDFERKSAEEAGVQMSVDRDCYIRGDCGMVVTVAINHVADCPDCPRSFLVHVKEK